MMRLLRFLLLWISLAVFFSLFNRADDAGEILMQCINTFLFAAGYYFSYHYLARPYLYQRKTLRFLLFFLLVVAVLSAVNLVSSYEIYVYQKKKFFVDNYWKEPVYMISNYVLNLLVVSSLLGFRFLRDKMQTEAMMKKLEKEKITTELEFLKAQINPHFLFNSLNNILFQIDKTNTGARDTLLKFSEMLRYQLYECSADYVDIEKEVQYLRNYIEIQMLRRTDKYDCTLQVADGVRHFSIAPLLIIPFVENAFKHVSHRAAGNNRIDISLDYENQAFVLTVRNDKDETKTMSIHETGGIGLANVRRRLDLLYERRYELDIVNEKDYFQVQLHIHIDKNQPL